MITKFKYALLSFVLFLVEVIIEKYFKDGFVRYYLGDVFIAMLIYLIIRTITNLKQAIVAVVVLIFTFTVEFLQLINILAILEIQKTKFTSIVLGHTYSFYDLTCYLLGVTIVYLMDDYLICKKLSLKIF